MVRVGNSYFLLSSCFQIQVELTHSCFPHDYNNLKILETLKWVTHVPKILPLIIQDGYYILYRELVRHEVYASMCTPQTYMYGFC